MVGPSLALSLSLIHNLYAEKLHLCLVLLLCARRKRGFEGFVQNEWQSTACCVHIMLGALFCPRKQKRAVQDVILLSVFSDEQVLTMFLFIRVAKHLGDLNIDEDLIALNHCAVLEQKDGSLPFAQEIKDRFKQSGIAAKQVG